MTYKIEWSSAASRHLRRLPPHARPRLRPAIDRLADDPRPVGAVAMDGQPDAQRIHVGDYRVVYEVRDDVLVVLVLRVGHRREIYRRL